MTFLCTKGCDVDSVWRVFEMERNQHSPVCWKHSWSVQMQHAPDTTLTVSLCLFKFLKWNGYAQNAVLVCYTYYICTTVCILQVFCVNEVSRWPDLPERGIKECKGLQNATELLAILSCSLIRSCDKHSEVMWKHSTQYAAMQYTGIPFQTHCFSLLLI